MRLGNVLSLFTLARASYGLAIDDQNEITNSHSLPDQRNVQSDPDSCFMCSRFGSSTSLLVNNRPLPQAPEYTCAFLQENDVGLLPAFSDVCQGRVSLYENRCCDLSAYPDTYMCETNIRSMLLGDDSGYDPTVRPTQLKYDLDGAVQMRGVDVDTVITFVTLRSLDIKSSTLEIFIAVTLTWHDPRLAWTVGDNSTNCATTINARASPSIEETEIWVPSLDLLTQATSMQDFPTANAVVTSDGLVSWQRTGPVTAICSFVGLPRMPFDDLGCRMYFADNDANTVVDYVLVDLGNNQTKGYQYVAYVLCYALMNLC